MSAGDDPHFFPNVIQRVQRREITLAWYAKNRIDPVQKQSVDQNLSARAQIAPRYNSLILFVYYATSTFRMRNSKDIILRPTGKPGVLVSL